MARRGVLVDGGEIRRLREEAAYERRELADLVGIDYHTLYRIETGKLNTSMVTLRRIALALKVSPSHLKSERVELLS